MIKNILNLLKCCKSKHKQQKEEMDIQIVGNKEIKKILSEYRIEDRDFNTFTSDRSSVQTNNTKNDKFNHENSNQSKNYHSSLDTEIIEEAKENRMNEKNFKETDSVKGNFGNNYSEIEMKNNNDYYNQATKTEGQNLCDYVPTNEDSTEDDSIIVPEYLIREDEKNFIKFVKKILIKIYLFLSLVKLELFFII